MDSKYVLAMYDIRGKQQYIFRSNHIKEIVGGSAVIRDCYNDYLYPAAIQYRNRIAGTDSGGEAIYTYHSDNADESGEKKPDDTEFSVEAFKARMAGGQYIGEVVYDGGGNFMVLYRDKETCIGVNRIFTKAVLEKTYTLKVLCTYIEDVDFKDYIGDRDRLYKKHHANEAKETTSIPARTLPFTQVDNLTSMPLYKKQLITRREDAVQGNRPVTRESWLKYAKYWEEEEKHRDEFGETVLDNLVTQKGEESLLAIVYIDGNNMGAKVQARINSAGGNGYEECIRQLREFSRDIQKNYVTDRMKDIDTALAGKYGESKDSDKQHEKPKKRRFVVYAGDEINFICNARDAYEAAKVYLGGLKLSKGDSACAGIAIFHSHAPYAEAYRIAEECCESGKQKMKREKLNDAKLMDVHYCQGGIGVDLETIRAHEAGDLISKPWFVEVPEDLKKPEYMTIENVEAMARELRKIGRTNVKSLAECARSSMTKLKMEIERIKAHKSGKEDLDFHLNGRLNDEQMRKLIYDIVILYDLWFDKKEKEGDHNEQE